MTAEEYEREYAQAADEFAALVAGGVSRQDAAHLLDYDAAYRHVQRQKARRGDTGPVTESEVAATLARM